MATWAQVIRWINGPLRGNKAAASRIIGVSSGSMNEAFHAPQRKKNPHLAQMRARQLVLHRIDENHVDLRHTRADVTPKGEKTRARNQPKGHGAHGAASHVQDSQAGALRRAAITVGRDDAVDANGNIKGKPVRRVVTMSECEALVLAALEQIGPEKTWVIAIYGDFVRLADAGAGPDRPRRGSPRGVGAAGGPLAARGWYTVRVVGSTAGHPAVDAFRLAREDQAVEWRTRPTNIDPRVNARERRALLSRFSADFANRLVDVSSGGDPHVHFVRVYALWIAPAKEY